MCLELLVIPELEDPLVNVQLSHVCIVHEEQCEWWALCVLSKCWASRVLGTTPCELTLLPS